MAEFELKMHSICYLETQVAEVFDVIIVVWMSSFLQASLITEKLKSLYVGSVHETARAGCNYHFPLLLPVKCKVSYQHFC